MYVQSRVTMIQCFSRKQKQLVLEQGLCPVSVSFVLALGRLWSFLLSDYLLPQHCSWPGDRYQGQTPDTECSRHDRGQQHRNSGS